MRGLRLMRIACVVGLWGSASAAPMPAYPTLTQIQQHGAARAAKLRAAWLAAGRALPDAASMPSLSDGKITTPRIRIGTAPDAIGVSMHYKAPAGLGFVELSFGSATTTQYKLIQYSGYNGGAPASSGVFSLQEPFDSGAPFGFSPGSDTALGLYSAPGTWNLASVQISDASGGLTIYNGAQLAKIFKTTMFTVVNTVAPDVTPPSVTAGKILTPTVSLSANPVFQATMTVSDDISGVASITLLLQNASFQSIVVNSTNATPVLAGSVALTQSLAGDATGSYTIEEYSICDYANNCVYDDTSADIAALFGTTTISVTN